MSAERPFDMLDYTQACAVHAEAQGLAPIYSVLRNAGIPFWEHQSGGFCMIAVVHDEARDVSWTLVSAEHLYGSAPGTVGIAGPHICYRSDDAAYDACPCHDWVEGFDTVVALGEVPSYLRAVLLPDSDPKSEDAVTATFTTPFEQYAAREGQPCEVLRWVTDPDADHDAEVLPMAVIRFADGVEIEAWPEEVRMP